MWLVLRGLRTPRFLALIACGLALATSAHAQESPAPRTLYEIPLRGGVRAALAAVGDRVPADRSLFLAELIRRVYDMPATQHRTPRDAVLQAFLSHLDRMAGAQTADRLPLPLAPDIWISQVFGGRAEPGTLVPSIVASREASLLYYALLSLDDETRAWIAGERDLVAEIAAKHAAPFLLAAPSFRVKSSTVQVPGGDRAVPVWQSLAGRDPREPAAFLRALLTRSNGRLAYVFGALAQLTPDQTRFALKLDTPAANQSIDAGRRLLDIFVRVAASWSIADRIFWRPPLDPALLLAELPADESGRPLVPGTRALWSLLFDEDADTRPRPVAAADARALAAGEPADFVWLCERVFEGGHVAQRRPYEMLMFASRRIPRVTPENAADAIDAIRAAVAFPALSATLERAGVADLAVFAAAARRAGQLGAIGDEQRAVRALAQFQGSLALLTRAALRGSLSRDALAGYVSSLAAIEPNDRGEYGGRVVRWWDHLVSTHAAAGSSNGGEWPGDPSSARYTDSIGHLDRGLIRLLAGPAPRERRVVEWEGTRYRVDLAWAEATRLARILGDGARPYLSAAAALAGMADALGDPRLTRDAILAQVSKAEDVGRAVAPAEFEKTIAALERAAESGGRASRLAELSAGLRALADDLLARGLTELVYAVALGQAEGGLISAGDAAARHDFGMRLFGSLGPWRLPVAGADRMRDWHVTGALLALDVRLADFALVRLSSRPPLTRPTLNDSDRRVLIEAVALVQGTGLSDADRDTIVRALERGRARLADARAAADWEALADEVRLTGPRRSLLAWTAVHDRDRLLTFLSPAELLWLGLDGRRVAPGLDGWGAPAEPRLGCLCLQLPDRRPLDALAGRWESGMIASAFPDLNLRLAELLSRLGMPAALLPAVLASATVDLINNAVSRGQDDRRGLVEFVHALELEQVELYLATLTTDGPLVPVEDVEARTAHEPMGTMEESR